MRTLENFELADAPKDDLERHIRSLYAFIGVEQGKEMRNCDYTCCRARACKCYVAGKKENECDGECGAYDEGFADGKRGAKQEVPEALIEPIRLVRSARQDEKLGVGVSDLRKEVDAFIAVLDHSFHV